MHWESFAISSLAVLPVPAAVQRVLAGPIGGTATPHTLRSIACPRQSAFSGAVQLSPGSELALRSMALEKASLTQASPLRKQPLVVARLSGTCFSSSLVSNTIPIFCSCRNGRLCYV